MVVSSPSTTRPLLRSSSSPPLGHFKSMAYSEFHDLGYAASIERVDAFTNRHTTSRSRSRLNSVILRIRNQHLEPRPSHGIEGKMPQPYQILLPRSLVDHDDIDIGSILKMASL